MQRVKKSVLVPYAAPEMFELVDRVELYPKFLPWCGGTEVLEKHDDRKTARIDIDYHGVRAQFTTDNVNDPPASIIVTLKSGPFRHLHGEWRFRALEQGILIMCIVGEQGNAGLGVNDHLKALHAERNAEYFRDLLLQTGRNELVIA